MSAKPRCLGHVLLLVPLLILPACQSRSQSDDLQYVELSILEGNGILVEGKQSSLGTLAMTLEQVIDPDWSPVVMRVSCADELPIGRLQAVHRALRSQGLINMSYRTASDDELTLVLPTPDFNERLRELPSEDFATLHIDASGTVTLEGDATGYAEIKDEVTDRLDRNDHLVVSIDMDPGATYGDFIRVLGAAKEAKAPRIHLNDPS